MKIDFVIGQAALSQPDLLKIEHETNRRIKEIYPSAIIRVRKGSNNDLSVIGAEKTAKKVISNLLEEMFEDADAWLYDEDL